MTQDKPRLAPSDAELVAYLDGELSPSDSVRIGQQIAADRQLGERLDLLIKGVRPFGDAFGPLLREAPTERLEEMLSTIVDKDTGTRRRFPQVLSRHWAGAVAAAIGLMVAGAALDRLSVAAGGRAVTSATAAGDASDDWRRAVAQYLSFYTRDTLATVPAAGEMQMETLTALGARLGLDLTTAPVDLPGLTLMRAEIFEYDGRPLGFLAYLDPQSGPMALCMVAGSHDDALAVEHFNGLNAVHWSADNHDFMLIGRAGVDRLRSLAAVARVRRDGSGASGRQDHG